ncbi:hypothetical protein SAMN05444370_1427 [Rubrimonas cliftonensis]|uniref:Uncharacterized protein n=2 Tax=Rubrimonas cliftonensis TaxID=89524 RepID=A0A1H4G838_9RHOB|nr:hypothetical protein SAMN05444370_1427 [Rubrimonas cliftonensis]
MGLRPTVQEKPLVRLEAMSTAWRRLAHELVALDDHRPQAALANETIMEVTDHDEAL